MDDFVQYKDSTDYWLAILVDPNASKESVEEARWQFGHRLDWLADKMAEVGREDILNALGIVDNTGRQVIREF